MADKGKKRRRWYPYRIAAILLGVLTLALAVDHPNLSVSLEDQRKQVDEAAQLYFDTQAELNRLNTELAEVNTADFIERTARREYGFCWYGETIYEVLNLDELKPTDEDTTDSD